MSLRQVFWFILSAGLLTITAAALLSLGGLILPSLEQTTFSCALDDTPSVICERQHSLFGQLSDPDVLTVRSAEVVEVCDTDNTSCRYPVMLQTDQGELRLTSVDPPTQALSNQISDELNAMVAGTRTEPIQYTLGPHWFLASYYSLFALLGLGMALTAGYGIYNRLTRDAGDSADDAEG